MASFRVLIDGVPVDVSSPEDALALIRASKRQPAPTGSAGPVQVALPPDADQKQSRPKPPTSKTPRTDPSESVASGAIWGSLIASLNRSQLDVLYTIKNNPDGVTSPQIGELLDREANSIAGTIGGGLQKNIPRAGLDFDQVIRVHVVHGKNHYLPGPLLLAQEVPPIK
jgi:hypothetical protein